MYVSQECRQRIQAAAGALPACGTAVGRTCCPKLPGSFPGIPEPCPWLGLCHHLRRKAHRVMVHPLGFLRGRENDIPPCLPAPNRNFLRGSKAHRERMGALSCAPSQGTTASRPSPNLGQHPSCSSWGLHLKESQVGQSRWESEASQCPSCVLWLELGCWPGL